MQQVRRFFDKACHLERYPLVNESDQELKRAAAAGRVVKDTKSKGMVTFDALIRKLQRSFKSACDENFADMCEFLPEAITTYLGSAGRGFTDPDHPDAIRSAQCVWHPGVHASIRPFSICHATFSYSGRPRFDDI